MQPAIEDNTLEFEGRRIPIDRENTRQLVEAVQTLRSRLEKDQDKSPLATLENHMDRTVGEISGALRRSEGTERELLILMIEDHASRVIDTARQILGEQTE